MLVVYPLPDKGKSIYRLRRGSGLFIADWVFGDTLNKINRNNVLRFLYIIRKRILIVKFGDIKRQQNIMLMKKQALKSFKHLFAFICLLSASLPAFAHDVEVDGIYYNITSSTDLTVGVSYQGTSYSSYSNEYSGNITIPQTITYEGTTYSVTSIGDSAFRDCYGLTSVTISENITSIGAGSFDGCNKLTSVTIPHSVISIGDYAFYGCSNLDSVSIGNGVTSIGAAAFENCFSLKSVIFNATNCTKMGLYYSPVFRHCSSLSSITIGNEVQTIPDNAFRGCSGLITITIPKNVTSIGNSAFMDCSGLTRVDITDLTAWCNIEFSSSDSNPLFYAKKLYLNGDNLTNLQIPDEITSIGKYSFYNCTGLTKLTIPNNVTSIGFYSFSNCLNLRDITIPSSVTSIDSYAFLGCSGLVTTDIQPTQTTLKITLTSNTGYNGFVEYGSYIDGENDIYIINNLTPNTKYYYINCGLKINNNYCYISYEVATTASFEALLNGTLTASSITAQGSYTEGDMTILAEGINLGSTVEEYDNENSKTFTNLDPNTSYSVYYSVDTKEGGIYTASKTFTTEALTWSDGDYQATSTTSARLMNTTNCDATEGTGFEWRRYGAPENLKPNVVTCPVVDGVVIGSLRGLNPDVYYEFRPYYTSASGNTYYGEWAALFTGDANVYFEPEVKTYNDFLVSANNVTLKGYALAGTDDITSQGFEYWKPVAQTASMASPYSENDVKKVEVSGISMTTTIGDLEYATTYCYRAFVTTAKGTVYGDTMQFTTEADLSGVEEIIAPENNTEAPVEYYTLQGIRVQNPEKGLYIKRQGNKTTKIFLK